MYRNKSLILGFVCVLLAFTGCKAPSVAQKIAILRV